MSHFTCVVVSNSPEEVEELLQPYHEFECTGVSDQYVENIDQTDEALSEYNDESKTITRLRAPDGSLHNPYEDRFYRDPTPEEEKKYSTGRAGLIGSGSASDGVSWASKDWGDGRGHRGKIHFTPDGWSEVEILRKQAMTFREFIAYWHGYESDRFTPEGGKPDPNGAHKYGWVEVNAAGDVTKVIRRTNPNAKWDWWVIGGRWTGYFKLNPGAAGITGRPSWGGENAPAGYADQARKGDIAIEQMRIDAAVKARAKWKKAREITGGLTWDSWDDTLGRYKRPDGSVDIDQAREEYHAQPAIELLKAAKNEAVWSVWSGDDDLSLDEEIYVQRARDAALVPYAFIKDGQWVQKGQMGWFGMSSDDMSAAQWNRAFNQMLDALPDDALLTAVDCHI